MRHLFEWVQAILGGWDIIFGKWGWVGVYGNYFGLARVSRSGWGIIVGELWWVGHYCGWMGVGGCELTFCIYYSVMPSHLILFWLLFMEAAGLLFLLTWNFSKAFFLRKKPSHVFLKIIVILFNIMLPEKQMHLQMEKHVFVEKFY